MLVFADLFGASDFNRELWGPPGFAWHDAFGPTGLAVAQNVGQIYVGALVAVAVLGFGVVRGTALDARDSLLHRGDGADAALCARQIHAGVSSDVRLRAGREALPPAGRRDLRVLRAAGDARRLSGAPLADRHRPAAAPMAARCRDCRSPWRSSGSPSAWRYGSARCKAPRCRSCGASDLPRPRSRCWCWRAALLARSALAAAALLAGFTVADLGWNNAPNESTGLKPSEYEALRPDTDRRNRRAAEVEAQGRRRARPPRPRRTDRHRLSLAEHRADPRLRSSVRAQSAAADGLRARHRRARHGRRRRPAAVSAADVLLSLDAGKPVRRALHRHRRAGRADRQVAQAGRSRISSRAPRTPMSTKIRARCRA